MNSEENNYETERMTELLSVIKQKMTPADREYLVRLREKTEKEFEKASKNTKLWNRITRSQKIKWITAAAVVMIAFAYGIYNMDGPAEASSIDFAAMTKAIKEMPWMHVVTETVSGNVPPTGGESWMSFNRQIIANKDADGNIRYQDFRNGVRHIYNPKLQTITNSYIAKTQYEDFVGSNSVLEFWELFLKPFKEAGVIVQEIGEYQGRKALICKIDLSGGPRPEKMEIVVDPDNNLPLLLISEDSFKSFTYFDYPKNGPESIYDLGAPVSAQIIDNLPPPEITEIIETYRRRHEDFTSRYIAVVTVDHRDQNGRSAIPGCIIIYKNGRLQRIDEKTARIGEFYEEDFAKFNEQIGDTFESIRHWWTNDQNCFLTCVELLDGSYYYRCEQNDNHEFENVYKSFMGSSDPRADDDLADFGWYGWQLLARDSFGPSVIIEDEYSIKHHLIGLEMTSQGNLIRRSPGIDAFPPEKIIYYLNPQRDYISQRFVSQQSYEAPWLQDKGWLDDLGIFLTKHQARNSRSEVLEYGLTNQGQWYPKVIEHRLEGVVTKVYRVYLKTDAEFPEGFFKADKLPKR